MYEFLKNRIAQHQKEIKAASELMQHTREGSVERKMARNRIIMAQAYQNEALCILAHLNGVES